MSQADTFNWRRLAACKNANVEIFMPPRGRQPSNNQAMALCGGCPVKAQCLAEAMGDLDLIGIWGGLTHGERVKRAGRKSWGSAVSLTRRCPEMVGVPRPVPNEFVGDRLARQRASRRMARERGQE